MLVLKQRVVFAAQMQKLVGKLDFAQTAVGGQDWASCVASNLRPRHERRRRKIRRTIQMGSWLVAAAASEYGTTVGSAVDVPMFSDAFAIWTGLVAVASLWGNAEDFPVLWTAEAEAILGRWLRGPTGIHG